MTQVGLGWTIAYVIAVATSGRVADTVIHEDYVRAYEAADARGRMLMIACVEDLEGKAARKWKTWLADDQIRNLLGNRYELALLTTDSPVPSPDGEGSVPLLEHPGFAHLHGEPGIIMIDLTGRNESSYEKVVFLYPFEGRYHATRENLIEMLKLPLGTLTQRMLIFAVRVHEDDPRSADSEALPLLVNAAQSHAQYQADIQLQGHHHWERRFQELLAELPDDVMPYEVCAESWPGETLIEAAHECVHSWRQSSGHWQRVASKTRFYGYDMKRGSNGIWYGTGILAIDRDVDF